MNAAMISIIRPCFYIWDGEDGPRNHSKKLRALAETPSIATRQRGRNPTYSRKDSSRSHESTIGLILGALAILVFSCVCLGRFGQRRLNKRLKKEQGKKKEQQQQKRDAVVRLFGSANATMVGAPLLMFCGLCGEAGNTTA